MSLFEDTDITIIVNSLGIILGILYGIVAQRTEFCINGSIKDYILHKSSKRFSSYLMAVVFAIISTQIYSYYFGVDLSKSIYQNENLNILVIIIGGLIFGHGMMLADGCGNRQLVRLAQGDIKAFLSLIIIGIFAFIAGRGLLAPVIQYITNDMLSLSFIGIKNFSLLSSSIHPFVVISVIIAILLLSIYKIRKSITKIKPCIDGAIIGTIVGTGWFATGYVGFDEFEPMILESFSFVYPVAETITYAMYYTGSVLEFPICLVIGILIGAFASSKLKKSQFINCATFKDTSYLKSNIYGSAYMGIGGVMALGCSVGQGISGVSTLAFASIIAIISIFISAYFTGLSLEKKGRLTTCRIFD